jgi:mannitol/fructose-specific phosphotransferase system IIA component (Ntr-type)
MQMKITDLLTAELVFPALEANGKEEAIETLGMRLAAHHADVDGENLVQALWERERQVTTALGDGVAIPHARLLGLDRTVAAFARSRTGVHWDSPDGSQTHLVFLLAGPAELPGVYLKALAGVSRLLSDARCRVRLMDAADETELLLVLQEEQDRGRSAVRAA